MGVGDIQDRPGWAQTGWGEQAATQPVVQQDSPEDGGSLRDLIRRRREERHAERSEVIPITGYSGLLAGRYESLPYKAARRFYDRAEKNIADADERELSVAADILLNSCIELLEKREGGEWRHAGKWNAETVRQVFGASESELPDGVSARDALRWVLNDWDLLAHFREHQEKLGVLQGEIDEEMAGESEAASEAA